MICNRNRNIEIQIESVPAETEITLYSDGLGFLYPCDRWPFLDLRLRAGWLSLSHCMHWMIRLPSICAGSSWTTNSPKNHGQWSTFFFLEKIDLQLQGNEPYIYWSFCRQMWAAVTGTLCPTCQGETAMFFTPVFTLTGGMQQPHFSNFGDQTGFKEIS